MFFWFVLVLMPFLAFGFVVHWLVRGINGRFRPGLRQNASTDKPIPLWAEMVLIGLPLIRYGLMVLGQMVFALSEESWGDNQYPDVRAFRRRYPESFLGDTDGFFVSLPDVLVLLDTLFVAALLVWFIRWLQRRAFQRRHPTLSLSGPGADDTIWPPPPKPPGE